MEKDMMISRQSRGKRKTGSRRELPIKTVLIKEGSKLKNDFRSIKSSISDIKNHLSSNELTSSRQGLASTHEAHGNHHIHPQTKEIKKRLKRLSLNCKACKLSIDPLREDYLQVDQHFFHEECLKCSNKKCQKKLKNKEFFLLDGKHYCTRCYYKRERHICAHCHKPIREKKFIKLHNGKSYHLDHFKCFCCGEAIRDINTQFDIAYITEYGQDGGSGASEVEQRTENSIEDSIRTWEAQTSPQASKVILEPNFGYAWFNGHPFCLKCFEKRTVRCKACGEPILDDYVELSSGTYHDYCLVCEVCGEVIEGLVCEGEDGGVYHPACYMKDCQKCDLCDDYILESHCYEFMGCVSFRSS